MKQIKNVICLLLAVFLVVPAMADNQSTQQTRVLQGNVVDENNDPVIGASVAIAGSTIGTMTNMDGDFRLENVTTAHKTLRVSYLGYATQNLEIAGRTTFNVKLALDETTLDEVVVVGYGVQKKAHLTGAIATVAPADVTDLASTSLAASLEGLMAGVSVNQSSQRPGETARINIRNSNTTNAGVLYVIDDFVCPPEDGEQMFNNLDPTMVESISILKDAAAAIYGARSAQGVVLVRTKRGHVGKPKISYSGQYGYTDEFYRSKMMDSYNYGLTWNAIRVADPTQGGFYRRENLFQADELEAMKSLDYDLLDKYWSSGLTQKHGINVSGGNDVATFFGGVSYVTQDGNMGKISYDRWNYRAGMDAKINKWTKASLQVSGDYGKTVKSLNKVGGTNAEKDYVMLLTRPRYIPEYVVDANGREYPIAPYGITNGQLEQSQGYHYDVIENLGNFGENMPQNMTMNASLEYDFGWSPFLKGLKVKGTFSKSISNSKDNEFGSQYELYRFAENQRGGSGSHLYMGTDGYPLDFDGLSTVTYINGSSSYLRRNMFRADSYQMNFIVTYARTFGLHDVSGLFTIEKAEREREYVWGQRNLPYSFTNLQSNGANGDQTTEFNRSESGMLSYIGRFNYSYADKYLAEFLIRSDASTKFAPENYWGIFPSLSLGWIVSQEDWFANNVEFVDFLKIRGSFGLLGRDNIDPWAWAPSYTSEAVKGPIFGSNIGAQAGAHFQLPNAVPNRSSHWDESYKSNLGLDMNFLKSRLSFTLEGYQNKNKLEFSSISAGSNYPTTVGAPASESNIGESERYGMEASLGWRDKIGKDFKYHLKLNTGYSDDKLINRAWVDPSTRPLDGLVPNERSDRGLWGYECIGMFKTYQEIAEYFAEKNLTTYMRRTIDNVHPGMLIFNDVRGSRKPDGTFYAPNDPNDPQGNVVDADDRVKISDRRNNIYGLTFNFGGEWKGLSLNAQVGASWGSYSMMPSQAISNSSVVSTGSSYDVMQYTNLPSFWSGNMFVYEDVLDAQGRVVAHQNRDALYPNLRFAEVNSVASTFWKVNNANVLLRNVTLAYSLPKTWVSKVGVESCRINITGQNLLDFYNPYPDKFMSQNSSYSVYPTLRKFTMGLNVSF